MKASLQTLCDQFIENRDTVKSAFKWDNSYVYPLCANIFCAHGQMAEAEKLTRCRKIIQEQTGISPISGETCGPPWPPCWPWARTRKRKWPRPWKTTIF